MVGVLYEERLEQNRRDRSVAGSGMGLCVGCFAGVGVGRTIGFGHKVSESGNTSVVVPSASRLFFHNGRVSGAFCGATVGFGVGSFFGSGLYVRKLIHIPSPLQRAGNGGTIFLLPNIPRNASNALRRAPFIAQAAFDRIPMHLFRMGGRLLRLRGR